MTKKHTKSALFTSVMALILCCAMLVGTTLAWFTDSVVSGMNQINAGNLDVELYHNDKNDSGYVGENTELFNDVTLWEPGVVVYENFRVENKGNLALKYQLALTFADATTTPDGSKSLADVLKVSVVPGGFNGGREEAQDLTYTALSAFALNGIQNGTLEKNQMSNTYGVVIYWEPDTDYSDGNNDNLFNMNNNHNALRDDATEKTTLSISLGIQLNATQLQYEEDSFDETYDADLELPEITIETPTADAFFAALAAGKTAVLSEDMTLETSGEIPAGVTAGIDLNGHTLTTGKGGIEVNGNLVVTNGTLNAANGDDDLNPAIQVNNGGILDIESDATVNVTGDKATGVYMAGGALNVDGTINVTGGANASGVMVMGSSADITVDGKIDATTGYPINQQGGTTNVVLDDSALTGTSMLSASGTMYLTYEGAKPVIDVDGTSTLIIEKVVANDVADNNALNTAISNGATEITLGSGNFIIPDSAQGKTLTIKGNGDTVIATQDDGSYEGCDYSLDGATVTFENITINTDSTTYTGYARMSGTYNNCTINGTYTLYGNSTFNNCTFNVQGDVYNIWTWGAPNATFNGCTFNSDGKALLLYGQENTKLTVNDCVFNDNGGLTDMKAAIEIGNDYDKSYTLIVNNTTVNGYEINDKGINTGTTLYGNKNSMGPDKLTVIIDGAAQKTAATQDELNAAVAAGNAEVTMAAGNYTMPEPDIRGKALTIKGTKDTVIDVSAVDARDQFVTGATMVFDGVTLNFGTANYMGFANTASLTFKNCTINGLQFLFGENVTFENCDLNSNGAEHCVWTYGAKNVTFTGCDFTYGDRGINCYSDNDVAGGKQTVNFTNCTFATDNTASKGAVEINSYYFSVGIEVNLTGCTAPAYGEMAYVSEWDSTNGAKTTINIK